VLEAGTQSLVVCLRCGKVLYQMPTTEITGIYRRVAIGVIERHCLSFNEHAPEIIFTDEKINKRNIEMEKIADLMDKIYLGLE
jgi:hypothetical protein